MAAKLAGAWSSFPVEAHFATSIKEVDLGARPPNCGDDNAGPLPWIFCIIRSDEVCARARMNRSVSSIEEFS
jgi:hypothetical protein